MTEMQLRQFVKEVANETKGNIVVADFAVAVARKAADAEREACLACVPTNWCDPMLTGPTAVVGKVADCRPIEAVLRATRERIMARSNDPVHRPEGRGATGG